MLPLFVPRPHRHLVLHCRRQLALHIESSKLEHHGRYERRSNAQRRAGHERQHQVTDSHFWQALGWVWSHCRRVPLVMALESNARRMSAIRIPYRREYLRLRSRRWMNLGNVPPWLISVNDSNAFGDELGALKPLKLTQARLAAQRAKEDLPSGWDQRQGARWRLRVEVRKPLSGRGRTSR